MRRRVIAVPLIIVINIAVYFMWSFASGNEVKFMADHFLVSWQSLLEGRYWTLLGSAFSHNMFLHIFLNMYVFLGFGSVVESVLGFWRFVRFYLVAGMLSSFAHALISVWLLDQPDTPALGASGAICGVVAVFALLFPREKILLLGIIPLPAIFGVLLAVGLDIWGLVAQTQGGGLPIGFGAHLGGTITGLFYYFVFLRKLARKLP